MQKVNVAEVRETEWRSTKGRFHTFGKELSVALGREPKSTDLFRRHPFDVMIARLPPGAIMCPYHVHSTQWEFYVVLSGSGTVREETGLTEIGPGDAFLFRPGEAHQITNSGAEDLVYYVIADNPLGEWCYYPDSRKWVVAGLGPRTVIKGPTGEYLDGEE